MANAHHRAPRPRFDSFDESTGPATPYQPDGDSRADLHEGHPHSGVHARRFNKKIASVFAIAYFLGALSATIVFLLTR